jgi:lysyl-tRNA synthetase class 2
MEELEIFSNQELEMLENVKSAGINPYPIKFFTKDQAKDIKADFASWEGKSVTVAGRVIAKREHGKAGFATILSNGTPIQIYFRKDTLGDEKFSIIKKAVTVGDIIGVTGTIFKTHTEEITIDLQEVTLLSKALSPLPEKWHGIENVEVRYRQRYLDLIINPGIREVFETRSKLIATIRKTLANQGYMEVETPTLQEIYGGALAKPFTTHHNALDQDLFLRIAPELYLKRLIIGGFEKVFEIGKMFRNEGISINHNPEFTMMELYQAYGNFETMMDITELIFKALCEEVIHTDTLEFKGQTIHMKFPFRRITLKEAFQEYGKVSITDLKDMEFAKNYLKQEGIRIDKPLSWSSVVDEVLKKKVEPNLIDPTFLYDYPLPLSPLAKKKENDPDFVERFQLVLGTLEVGNAFTELNDPVDQYERFAGQEEARKSGDLDAHTFDKSYIDAMKFGLPPTGGLGLGIDRIVMILTGKESIREVLLFPQLRKRD